MEAKNFIFGIYFFDGDMYSTDFDIFFGYKQTWEETKDPRKSLVLDQGVLVLLLKNNRNVGKKVFHEYDNSLTTPDEIKIPYLSACISEVEDYITKETIEYFKSVVGIEHSPEFEKEVTKRVIDAPKDWTLSPDFLKISRKTSYLIKNTENIPVESLFGSSLSEKVSFVKVEIDPGCLDPDLRFAFHSDRE